MNKTDKFTMTFLVIFIMTGAVLSLPVHATTVDEYMNLYDKASAIISMDKLDRLMQENRSLIDDRFIKALQKSGDDFFDGMKPMEALVNYRILTAAAKALDRKPLLCETLNKVGNSFLAVNNPFGAVKAYKHSRELAVELKDPVMESMALNGLARCNLKMHMLEKAGDLASQSFNLARKENNPAASAGALSTLGMVESLKNNKAKALSIFTQALKCAEASRDDKVILAVNWDIVKNAHKTRNTLNAEKALIRMSEIFRKQDNELGIGLTNLGRGMLATINQKNDEAIKFYGNAKKAFKAIDNPNLEGDATLKMMVLFIVKKDDASTMKLAREARYLFNRAGAVPKYLESLLYLSVLSLKDKKNKDAAGYAKEALDGYKTIEHIPGQVISIRLLGMASLAQGDSQKARSYFIKAKELAKKGNPIQTINMVRNMVRNLGLDNFNARKWKKR